MFLYVIAFPAQNPLDENRVTQVLATALSEIPHMGYRDMDTLPDLRGKQILFVLPLGDFGININYNNFLLQLRKNTDMLEGAVAGVLVDGSTDLYTKSVASELVLAANLSGCTFVGRPLVEGVGTLKNFDIQANTLSISLEDAYVLATTELICRVMEYSNIKLVRPKLVALHASSRNVSNTLELWEGIRTYLAPHMDIQEIGLRNGTVSDCSGCPYTTCLHFGEQGGCFYGGVMSDAVYPAIRQADAILMICPNYNDALSANLTAFINRLTALFRQMRFYDKKLYAIVVSGYSGGDIVARQLISALNMNKSFQLPSHFALIETANDPGEAMALEGINQRIHDFAEQIIDGIQRE